MRDTFSIAVIVVTLSLAGCAGREEAQRLTIDAQKHSETLARATAASLQQAGNAIFVLETQRDRLLQEASDRDHDLLLAKLGELIASAKVRWDAQTRRLGTAGRDEILGSVVYSKTTPLLRQAEELSRATDTKSGNDAMSRVNGLTNTVSYRALQAQVNELEIDFRSALEAAIEKSTKEYFAHLEGVRSTKKDEIDKYFLKMNVTSVESLKPDIDAVASAISLDFALQSKVLMSLLQYISQPSETSLVFQGFLSSVSTDLKSSVPGLVGKLDNLSQWTKIILPSNIKETASNYAQTLISDTEKSLITKEAELEAKATTAISSKADELVKNLLPKPAK